MWKIWLNTLQQHILCKQKEKKNSVVVFIEIFYYKMQFREFQEQNDDSNELVNLFFWKFITLNLSNEQTYLTESNLPVSDINTVCLIIAPARVARFT